MTIIHRLQGTKGFFIASDEDREAGVMSYTQAGSDLFIIDHTEVHDGFEGKGIGKRLIEETRKAAGGPQTTTLLLSAPTAMTFYQGIKMPHADNCFLYRREK